MDLKQLIEKYNVPAPRYSCYPAPSYWDDKNPDAKKWLRTMGKALKGGKGAGLDMYIHMPFCDSLCTFCGFEKRITQNHYVEEIYIEALLKQWSIYLDHFGEKPLVSRLHMGGGTPTFFSPRNLERLFSGLLPSLDLKEDCEISFEAHPASATADHMQALYDFGFRTISFGVQDFNETVLKTINRIQTYENVKTAVETARKIGYTRVIFDLIYGLPYQNVSTITETMKKAVDFLPGTVAFYSYIHVPREQPAQRSFKDSALAHGAKKIHLFEAGAGILENAGYGQIGIDHFALPKDPLSSAYHERRISRGFTGYTHRLSDALLGLGAIAISDARTAYAQSLTSVEEFHDKVFSNTLPIARTHNMTSEDILLKEFINSVMCYGEAKWSQEIFDSLNPEAKYEVIQIQKEGLIEVNPRGFKVTKEGKPFLRNISMIFDARRHRSRNNDAVFSESI